MKVFLLGLDGMTLRIVEPYIRANLLPNFKKILKDGAYGILRSTIPPVTGPAWTSLVTGKNPGKHGLYEFRKRNGYKTKLVTKGTSAYAEPLWKILSRNGKRVMVINVPFTYPPDEVNGIMISGMMTPNISTEFVFPKELKKYLFKIIPDYRIEIYSVRFKLTGEKSNLLDMAFKVTKDERKLMNHFLAEWPSDFFFITFVGPDRIQHFMWDEILSMTPECVEYYQLLDGILGDILQQIDDGVLFIASDHGFAAVKRVFFINNFFRDLGLLQTQENKKPERTTPNMGDIILRISYRMGLLSLKKYLPLRLVNSVKHFISKGTMMGPDADQKIAGIEIDWEKTKVFSSLGGGIISINLKGREPKGTVGKEDYEALCKLVERELLSIKDPKTGKNIVKAVFRGDEIYSPENKEDGRPDLLVVMNDGYTIHTELGKEILSECIVMRRKIAAAHERDGIFAAYGSVINNKRIDADIYDIMPTICYLMGTAIPEDVDGRVLTEVIARDFVAKNRIKFMKAGEQKSPEENALGEKETQELVKQLKNLGYLG